MLLLDVRTDAEVARGVIAWRHAYPATPVTHSVHELKPDAMTVIYCQSGGRSAQACAWLAEPRVRKGLQSARRCHAPGRERVYPWRAWLIRLRQIMMSALRLHADRELDACGLKCPLPILRTKNLLTRCIGTGLEDPCYRPRSVRDFQAFSRQTGNELLASGADRGEFFFYLRKK